MTEGESYLRLALAANVFRTQVPFPRATSEDFATDSFQNLLFSIARFHEFTGTYPEKITVVGYEMKRARFVDLHRAAIRWPADRFEYIGIDTMGEESAEAQQGEVSSALFHPSMITLTSPQRQNGYLPYTADLYGCHSVLLAKRQKRNPFSRFHSYHTSAPDIGPVLEWCPDAKDGGKTALFRGTLPWDHL